MKVTVLQDLGQGESKSKTQRYWDTARSWNWREIIMVGTAGFVILLFAYTGISKLLDYEKFVFQMRLAPVPLIKTVAPIIGRVLPWVELALAAMLYFENTRYFGYRASLVLMILFEIYISWMKIVSIKTGIHLPCTCGGIISSMGWLTHLIFNASVIVLLLLSTNWYKKMHAQISKS
ncbi:MULTISPECIES: MauE/DoxX family redox-associated membrane protein [Olivibacter]|uniref:MauE/DoxX family redox-associated membrane protein n=1 Tax=Olivibacter oleidegradans TaxID=760123 RepID=A0ABV6HIE3_9SPHI|nr:MauE/DoxX family redox-associated membrane protein [Olivibacter jilunii]